MAYYNKVGLLILNSYKTGFLVCEPGGNYGYDNNDVEARKVRQYLMPGGSREKKENDKQALIREIKEELNCGVMPETLKFIGSYTDVSATSPDRDVNIRLYAGKLSAKPKASSEIGALHFIGRKDMENEMLSPILKNKIMPDLIKRGILK